MVSSMSRLLATTLVIGFVIACAPPDSKTEREPDAEVTDGLDLPAPLARVDSPLAGAARDYLAAIDADDSEALGTFIASHYAPSILDERGVDGWTVVHEEIATAIGPTAERLVVADSPRQLEVLTRLDEEGDWLSWTFMLDDDSGLLKGIRVVNAAPPARWAPRFAAADARTVAERLLDLLQRPAVGFAIVTSDGSVDAFAAGRRRIDGDPVAQDDLFHIGSCTKSATALLVATLAARGELSWNDTIAESLDDSFEIHPAYREVTLAEVARHRAGLIGHSDDIAEAIDRYSELAGDAPAQRATYLRDVLSAEPAVRRGELHYSNAGFALLAHVAEQRLGRAYETLLQERVLDPLGAERTAFGWTGGPQRPDGIWGHSLDENALVPFEAEVRLGAFLAPAGDLALTLPDFARLAHQQIAGPRGRSPIVDAAAFAELHRSTDGYGAGLGFGDHAGRRIIGHTGSTGVYWSKFRAWPELGISAVVATNGPVDSVGERAVTAAFDAVAAAAVVVKRTGRD